jgi:hypothetical protein
MSKVIQLNPRTGRAPITENGNVQPRRRKNKDVRSREYLTDKEVIPP